ncbi:hypothetical protein [Methanobrevibacter woesei]|uniref:hypothetical protein n=1 Tax=Methanobrevibacter woesei TaxID=190976 RepID=UPI0039F485D3
MKFLKFLVILLIPLLFCSAAYASDATDTSDNIAISQQNIDLDNVVYVPEGESISDIGIDVENSVYVSENDYITSDGLKAGPQTDGPNPSVEFEADDPNNPVNFFINETFHGEIVFRNDGDAIGYQPFLEVVLPNEITDFKMFYLGNSVETIDLGVFSEENNYTILNPLTNKEVKGEAGQRLILAISPFGSYSSDIPDAVIEIEAFLNTTNVGELINFTVTPVFRYGADPLDNPTVDPPIYGDSVKGWIRPTVIQVDIDSPVHEHETVTGPNFPFQYNITVDIADGANVGDIVINNTIPSQLYFLNNGNHTVRITDKNGNVIDSSLYEIIYPNSNTTGGNLVVKFKNYTGSDAVNDINIEYWVYAPEFDNSTGQNQTILNPITGSDNVTNNVVNIEGTYDNVTLTDDDNVFVTLKAMAVQKYVNSDGEVKPGQNLMYTIYFEVSDYFSLEDFYFLDHAGELPMGAGQDFIWDSVFLTFDGKTYKLENGTYYEREDLVPNDGHWDLLIYVYKFLNDNNISNFEGGLYNDRLVNEGPFIGYINYNVTVNLNYVVGNKTLSSDDLIINIADGMGIIKDSKVNVTDSSRTELKIPSPIVNKDIIAINGRPVRGDDVTVRPGDNVTFVLEVVMPTGTVDDFYITDYFPLPIFDVSGMNPVNSTDGALPDNNHWTFGDDGDYPTDINGNRVIPTVEINKDENYIRFTFGDVFENTSTPVDLKIYLTLQVTSHPMADELKLANLLYMSYMDSINTTYMDAEIIHMVVQEPELEIVKDVNVTTVENGTYAKYNITVTNNGHYGAYDVTITDNFKELFGDVILNGDVLSISAQYNNGTVVNIDAGDFFNTEKGFTFDYLDFREGHNSITITYTVMFNENVVPYEEMTNTANITNFASIPGGINFATNPDKYHDNATVVGVEINVSKDFLGSNDFNKTGGTFNVTDGNRKDDLTIGESGIYEIVVDLPNAQITDLTITDYANGQKLIGYEIFYEGLEKPENVDVTIKNGNSGAELVIKFNGELKLSAGQNKIILRLTYAVLDSTVNPVTGSYNRDNTVYISTDGEHRESASDYVHIVNPGIKVDKEFEQNTVQGGDKNSLTITVTNNGKSPLYHVTIKDDLSGLLNFIDGEISGLNVDLSAPGIATFLGANRDLLSVVFLNPLNPGESVSIVINFTVKDDVVIGTTYNNVVSVTGSSMPDDRYNETRNYTASDSDKVSTYLPTIDKNITGTSISENGDKKATIGEEVFYEIIVELPKGYYNDLVITDDIPDWFKFNNGNYTINGQTVDINYDPVTGVASVRFVNSTLSGKLTILLNLTLVNHTSAVDGSSKLNTAIVYVDGDETDRDSDYVSVVEPDVNVNKVADKEKYEHDETVHYEITISNDGNSRGHNIVITDVLPEGLHFTGKYTISEGWTVSYNEFTRIFTITGDSLAIGESIKFTYDCTFEGDLEDILGEDFNNRVFVTSTSMDREDIFREYTDFDDETVHVIAIDLEVNKVVSSSNNNYQNNIVYVITVTNNGPDDATGVVVNDILPDGLIFISATGTGSYDANTGIWTIGNLANKGTVTLTITAKINLTGSVTNSVNVTGNEDETDLTNNNDSVTTIIPPAADLVVDKEIISSGNYSDEIIYTITVTNRGPDDATGVTVTDKLPGSLIFISSDNPDYNPANGVWTIGNLAVGDSVTLTITAKINGTGIIENEAVVSGNEYDQNLTNNNDSVTSDVPPVADLVLDKTININKIVAGEYINYIITIDNIGIDAALNVILHDSIPDALENVEYRINNGDWQEFTGDIYLRTIFANSQVTVEIRGIVNSGYLGNITNFANVSTTTSETDYTNNNDTVTGEVTAITDLKVVKEANDLTVVAGDNITYTVTITNYGPSDAVNVELRDYFDTSDLLNMQYSLDNVHWYSYAPGTVIQVGTIVSGDGRVIYFKALVNGSIRGNILNTVNITTDTPNEGENSSTVTTDVVEHVTISIDKTANVTNVNPGDYISYDIVVEVSDVSDAINVVVTDNLNSDLLETSNTIYFIDGVYKGRWTGSVNLGTLHPGAVVFIHLANIYVKNTADSDIPNTAIVTSDEYPNGFQSDYDIHLNTADLAVDKEVVSSGNYTDEIEYVITVTNNGPDDATGVVVSDKLPNGLIFTDSVADRGSYDPETGIWTIGDLANGETLTLTIIAKINITGNITNEADTTGDQYDPDVDNNEDDITSEILPSADLVVDKEVVSVGNYTDEIEYVITVTNRGPDDATGVTVSDILPEGLIFAGSDGNYNSNTGVWYIGDLANGEFISIRITAKINITGNVTNKVNVTGNEHDSNLTNNNDTVTSEIPPATDLAVDKEVVSVGNYTDEIEYVITVTNRGPDGATGVVVSDLLPDGLIYSSSVADRGTYDPETGIWTIGDLANGETLTLTIIAKINITGNITNNVSVTGGQYDPELGNNNDTVTSEIPPSADLVVDKEVVSVGNYTDEIVYIITVTNRGPDDATGVFVSDLLPDGLIYSSSVADRGTYDSETGIWTIGDLANGEILTLKITARINTTGNVTNNVNVTGNEHDSNLTNNNDTVTSEIPPSADLVVDKEVVSVGNYTDEIIYIITVTNRGPNDATGVTVSDILPDGLVFVESNGNYDSETGVWYIGDLANGGTVTLTITARINTTGNVTNNVNVTGNEHDSNLTNNNDTVTSEIPPSADLAIDKEVIGFGNYTDHIIYVVTVTNNGPNDATGVVVSDLLPNGLIFVEAMGVTQLYDDQLVFSGSEAKYDPTTGLWIIGDLANGESISLLIVARINITGNVTNYANVTGNEHDSNLTNNDDNVTVEIPPSADLAVEKEVVSVGNYTDEIVYIISVTNRGPNDATGVVVSDLLPDGLVFIEANNENYNAATGVWYIGDLANGESISIMITARINVTGNVTNFVNVTGNEFDHDKTNNNDNVTVEIPKEVDLSVNKTVNNENPYNGDEIIYEIVISNNGVDNATNVIVSDNLPNGLIYVSSDASKGSYDATTGLWTVGDLAVGETVKLTITVLVNKSGNLTNNVSVNSTEHDLNYTDNNDSVVIDVIPVADLVVDKEANQDVIYVGDEVIFIITITNNGPNDAENVIALDKLPEGLEFVSSNASKGTYDFETGIWDIGNLTVGETVTLIITTIAQKEGIIVNNVSVNSTTVDLNMTNNFANATVEANEVIVPSDDSSQSSELGLSQNKNNLLNSGIGMEKTGNPLMIALLLIICLIGFGVNSRRK